MNIFLQTTNLKNVSHKKLLQILIRIIDAQLFETIIGEIFEAKYI